MLCVSDFINHTSIDRQFWPQSLTSYSPGYISYVTWLVGLHKEDSPY